MVETCDWVMADRRGENRPDDWLYDILTRMEATEARHHSEHRSQLEALLLKVDKHAREDDDRFEDHSQRILVIETERKGEQERGTRLHGFQSLGIAAALMAAWEIIKRKILDWH